MFADDQPAKKSSVDRRKFLKYIGAGAGAIFGTTAGSSLLQLGCAPGSSRIGSWVRADGTGNWRQPGYPVPLPGSASEKPDSVLLASYEVRDELVLPEGYRFDIVAEWGQVFGSPDHRVRFGYGNDYTGLLKIDGTQDQYWLFVNHEYVSIRPWLEAFGEMFEEQPPEIRLEADTRVPMLSKYGIYTFDGYTFSEGTDFDAGSPEDLAAVPPETLTKMKAVARKILGEMGVSVLRVRRLADGRFEVVKDADDHRRITAFDRQNVAGSPDQHSRFTGPAAWLFETAPRGTMSNCSGGTTPWGTFLTCEENIHNDTNEDISPAGREIPGWRKSYGCKALKIGDKYDFEDGRPYSINGNGHLLEEPLDGRQYGWVCEVEPETGHLTKHTALGRFRHENVALRADAGKPLAAYMGDDRRGGHIWKFVSKGVVEDPKDPANSKLLEEGTLYVARFREDFTGEWVPLQVDTPLRRPEPEFCFSQHIYVPSRFVGGAVKVGNTDRDQPEIEVEDWMDIIADFAEKPFVRCTLGDLVRVDSEVDSEADDEDRVRQKKDGILSMDAFLMANAVGGTPSARPEDLEVHPRDRSVYIAFTDATESSDGSPDRRIFPDSAMESSRQYGAIYRIIEGGDESAASNPAATDFTWGKFVSSGEAADQGGGFACADNMVFDPSDNLWMVTDISTSALNFPTSRQRIDGTHPGGKNFPGVFGNNAMFMFPTSGERAGLPQLFAIAPMEAEFCGPTFTDDGETLILAIQHPGELDGARKDKALEQQVHVVHDRDNKPFNQQRSVPIGSNFPHGEDGRAPRPCVVCITRS